MFSHWQMEYRYPSLLQSRRHDTWHKGYSSSQVPGRASNGCLFFQRDGGPVFRSPAYWFISGPHSSWFSGFTWKACLWCCKADSPSAPKTGNWNSKLRPCLHPGWSELLLCDGAPSWVHDGAVQELWAQHRCTAALLHPLGRELHANRR